MLNVIVNDSNRRKSVMEFVKEAERMIDKYNWQNKTVHPYSYPVKITKVIKDIKSFDNCTECSKEYLVCLANGLGRILNSWEKYENSNKIKIKGIKSGQVIVVNEDIGNEFINSGLAIKVS